MRERERVREKLEAFYLPSALSLIIIIIEWRNCLSLVIQRLLLCVCVCALNLCNHLKDLTGQNVLNNCLFSLSHKFGAPFSPSSLYSCAGIIHGMYAPPSFSLGLLWLLLFCVKISRLPTYTSQYWLRSYAIQFIWNMMDNDDGIEWQNSPCCSPRLSLCTQWINVNTITLCIHTESKRDDGRECETCMIKCNWRPKQSLYCVEMRWFLLSLPNNGHRDIKCVHHLFQGELKKSSSKKNEKTSTAQTIK